MEKNFIFSGREFQDKYPITSNSIQIGNYSYEKEVIEKMEALAFTNAEKLDLELNKASDFDDFINQEIEKTSVEMGQKYFEVHKYLWNKIGRDISNHEDVYYNNISLALKNYSFYNDDKITEIDNIIKDATNHYPYVQEDIYNNGIYSNIEERDVIKESNNPKDKENFKWINPFSPKGILYIGILGVIIYILYNNISISYTGFLIVGILVLFAFLYFENNYKRK